MSKKLRFRCKGHKNLRATHHKTLELTRESDISQRGTCILGVASTFEPRSVAALRGTLEITLQAAEFEERFRATANPFMAISDSLVFRRSEQRFGNTFAIRSEKSARDLHRGLVASMASPETELDVTLEEVADEARAGALMLSLGESGMPIPAETLRFVEAADVLSSRRSKAPPSRGQGPGYLPCRTPGESSALFKQLMSGKRIALCLGIEDLRAGSAILSLVRQTAEEGIPLTCIGAAPPWLRGLAMSGFPALPFALRDEPTGAAAWKKDLASPVLRQGAMISPCSASQLCTRLSSVAEAGQDHVFVARDLGGRKEQAWWGNPRRLAETIQPRRGSRELWTLVLSPQELSEDEEDSEIPRSLFLRLVGAEVPLKTLAKASQEYFGGSHRAAYKYLLELKKSLPDTSRT